MLRMAGMEFGTTTGRPRRCGWLDLIALKYCRQINGFSSLNLTKLDVLSGLSEIKLGVSYHKPGGETVESFPADLELLEQIQVCQLSSLFSAGFYKGVIFRKLIMLSCHMMLCEVRRWLTMETKIF
jgi:adenylosuccinate synthase